MTIQMFSDTNWLMILTVPVKLLPSPEQASSLLQTMQAMNAAATVAAQIGFDNHRYDKFGIQRLCYYYLRERYNLVANMAIRSIGKAVGSFARDKTICPTFNLLGAVPFDKNLCRLIGLHTASLSTIAGRIHCPIHVAKQFQDLLQGKRGQADLVYRNNQFFLYVSVEVQEEKPVEIKEYLGIDLGIVNLAVDNTSEFFTGEQVERNRRRHCTARKQYQRKGTKNAKRKLKKMAGRQSRYQHWVNHNISKRLVEKAKALQAAIGLEDLTGIRKRLEETVNKAHRRRLGNWGFYHLRTCIEYKAKRTGLACTTIDPYNTSRTCSKCGHCEEANRPSQAKFKCKQCGYSSHADVNAACNIQAWAIRKLALKVATNTHSISDLVSDQTVALR